MVERSRQRGRRPTLRITASQRLTLQAICDYVAEHRFAPTMRELADARGITPPSALEQVRELERKGYVQREPRKARGLTVLREPQAAVASLVRVPLVGDIAAGQPLMARENVVGEVLMDEAIAQPGHCFALTVAGESMVNAGIHDGDVLIVRQQPVAESGDIVVALLGDDATVKRLVIAGDRIELRPENPAYRPVPIAPGDDLRILGKVVAVTRERQLPPPVGERPGREES